MFSRLAISSRLQQLAHQLQIPSFRASPITTKTYATMVDHSKWKFNHTMLRVKDPQKSLDYYKLLGLSLVNKIEFPDNKFDLYFLAYDGPKSASPGHHFSDREGVLELTHNYGSENDSSFTINNGNKDPHKGFGHICVSVDNIQAACQRIEDAGYKFQKKLTDGRMRSIAFALDPDGYWVEIIGQNNVDATKDIKTTETSAYRFNHSMIRIKDPEKSLKFYQEVMGMTLLRTSEQKEAGFTLYFLGYPGDFEVPKPEDTPNGVNPLAQKEGLLELTWNYGTEKEEGKVYHNGNDEPQGFGHICISVDDLDQACQFMEDKKVNWKKRLTDGRMKNVAFVLDPDEYWVEIIQNETLKK
ncbi:Glyoxalase/Bleomycin resistance protein/Dihydroxybiphenyl dioxygenase [Exophiala viscosa]|uniref:lactoylglutathione lyase n=1 Tax=Exophiala viscosa TaxID=2486360 RepID=A0AAN6DUE8_9EURO|nr:Glyoxalase/Bleomycin resistance protein/Dihydroxybiphenyl dioxygenase [Exophiala viscosa]